jgi:hypothetical protein
VELDGVSLPNDTIALVDEPKHFNVRVVMGEPVEQTNVSEPAEKMSDML